MPAQRSTGHEEEAIFPDNGFRPYGCYSVSIFVSRMFSVTKNYEYEKDNCGNQHDARRIL